MIWIVKKFLLIAFSSGLLFVPVVYASALGHCGSTLVQQASIPEYNCFSHSGISVPYATCVPAAAVGFKPVHFGEACKFHDQCYATAGSKKKKCDQDFRQVLANTCELTLDGKFRSQSLKSCVVLAEAAYGAVGKWGCPAFLTAQKAAGIEAPNCYEFAGPVGATIASPVAPARTENPAFVQSSSQDYAANEAIVINYSGLPGNATDWITLSPRGSREDQYGEWFYTRGARSGSMTFRGVAPGIHELRVYYDWPRGGWEVKERIAINVVARLRDPLVESTVSLVIRQTYMENEPIEVEFEGMPGNKTDWLSVVPMGAPDSTHGTWYYTAGLRSGKKTFPAQKEGDYEVRAYFNWPTGKHVVERRLSFRIAR